MGLKNKQKMMGVKIRKSALILSIMLHPLTSLKTFPAIHYPESQNHHH